MRVTRLTSTAGSAALLFCALASASSAQESSRRAPIVRVSSQDGGGVVSNYVTPAITVSEDAYVFAVMMDLDGRIQVLHPDYPGISVRVRSHNQLRLPNFFAGFNDSRQRSVRYSPNGMVTYDQYDQTGTDTRGTVIALASRVPFKLDLIEADGDWDIAEIRRLIEYRTPGYAARALAQYLGANGESIGRDYMRFAGARQNYYAYDDLAYCGYGYGYGSMGVALTIAQALKRQENLPSARFRPVVIGYDACGMPIVVAQAVSPGGGVRVPSVPRHSGDTTIFPKSRTPQGISRNPGGAEVTSRPVPEGVFPLREPAEAQSHGAIPAPEQRRAAPRDIADPIRYQPGSTSIPDRPRPVERTAPPRNEPGTGEMQPVHRAEPRVIERAEPVRAPERIREAPPPPAPVVHERPDPPPPPPPRAEQPPPPPPPAESKAERPDPPPRHQ